MAGSLPATKTILRALGSVLHFCCWMASRQTRVTYSRYRCRELNHDPWLAFSEAARELKENQERCLKYSPNDVPRCRINSYNSGTHYARWAVIRSR